MLLLDFVEVSVPEQMMPVPHWRPDWQQPPPRLAGQENQPVVQVYDVEEVGVVGMTIIAVLDGGAEDMTVGEDGVKVAEEEGGATIAVEVATATHPTS